MSSGTDDKRKVFGLPYNVGIGLLCVLGALCLYEFYSNVLAGPPGASPDAARTTAVAPAPAIPIADSLPSAGRRPASTQRRNSEEFNPVLHSKRPEDRIDPKNVDPTLRLDLLTKVQAVELAGGTRNLFQMGQPPPPKVELPKGPETIVSLIGPKPPPPPIVAPPPPPPPPPQPAVQLKFYGYSMVRNNGKRTGYFMDGEDIAVAAEGEMVMRRYRVIRIQATSVQVEDTEGKRTITLPIVAEGGQD